MMDTHRLEQLHKPQRMNTSLYQTSGKDKDQTRISLVEKLNGLEVQIRTIKKLIEKDSYFNDVIDEIASARKGLDSIAKVLLEENLKKCTAERIRMGNPDAFDKLLTTVEKLLKM